MIVPLRNLLLIRLLDPEERDGSIILPEVARDPVTHDGLG